MGCDRYFSPDHPLDRYCGDDCRAAAARWRIAKANLKYRASQNGKEKRREQAARYRVRLHEQAATRIEQPGTSQNDQTDAPDEPREGYHKDESQENSSCDRPGLTSRELSDVVDLLSASSTTEQTDFVLSKPREALRQSQIEYAHHWDPRMSVSGNRVAKRLGMLLDCLAKMNSWLRYTGRAELQAIDREPLTGGFGKLVQETALVNEAVDDFLKELKLP